MHKTKTVSFMIIMGVGLTLLLLRPQPTHAQIDYCFFILTDLAGDGYTITPGSHGRAYDLRRAIDCANNNTVDNTILLDGATITLNDAPADYDDGGYNGLPKIHKPQGSLTIKNGTIQRSSTLDCNGDSGDHTEFRLLYTDLDSDVILENLTLRNGCASDVSSNGGDTYGGAILNAGTLRLNSVHLADNAGGFGGTIYNQGSLTGANVSFVGNRLHGSNPRGAALAQIGSSSQITLVNTTFSQNDVLARSLIWIQDAGSLTLINATLTANIGSGVAIDFNTTARDSGSHSFHNVVLAGNSTISNCSANVQNAVTLSATGSYSDDASCDLAGRGGSDNASATFGTLATAANGTQYYPLTSGDPLNGGSKNLLPTEANLGIDVDQDGTIETTTISIDQRGSGRVQASVVDAGSYEVDCTAYNTALASAAGYTLGSEQANLATDLRQAIGCANNINTNDRINLNGQTVTLDNTSANYDYSGYNGLPPIEGNGSLTLDGGIIERSSALDCNGDSGDHTEFRLLTVKQNATSILQNLTLRNGCARDVSSYGGDQFGGAILNEGTLRLNTVHLADNTGQVGGAIFNVGTLIGTNASFVGNSLPSGSSSAAVLGQQSSGSTQTTLVNTTISQNDAAGKQLIMIHSGDLTLINATLTTNTGGGVAIDFDTTARDNDSHSFHNVVLAGNSTGSNCGANVQNAVSLSATGSYSDDASCDFASRGGTDNASASFGTLTTAANGTQYHPLTAGDPLNGGDNSVLPTEANLGIDVDQDGTIEATPISIDQRGSSRIQAGTVEGGAYEVSCAAYNTAMASAAGYMLGSEEADLVVDLRHAIECANSNGTDDRINLNSLTVTLDDAPANYDNNGYNGLPPIVNSGSLTMDGGTIERGSSFDCSGDSGDRTEFRLLRILDNATVTLQNLTLRHGCASDVSNSNVDNYGGAIYNTGTLYFNGVHLVGNSGYGGGTIFNVGTLIGANVSFVGNSLYGSGALGAVLAQGLANAQTTLVNATLSQNDTANKQLIWIQQGGDLTLINSTLTANVGGGTAIDFSNNSGSYSFHNVVLAGNSAGSNCSVVVQNAVSLSATGSYSDDASCDFASRGGSDNASVSFGPLTTAANGTQFHPLTAGAPLNGGDNSVLPTEADLGIDVDQDGTIEATPISIDQRGSSRIQAGTVEGGAYEVSCDPYNTAMGSAAGYMLGSELSNLAADLSQALGCYNGLTGSSYTIHLNADLILAKEVTTVNNSSSATLQINGNGHSIDGDNTYRPFTINDGEVTIADVTLSSGVGERGGAINVGPDAIVRLAETMIVDSLADFGGAIYNAGLLYVTSSTFANNTAVLSGGAIFNQRYAQISNSTFTANSANFGGAIAQFDTMDVYNSTFANHIGNTGSTFYATTAPWVYNSIITDSAAASNCSGSTNRFFSTNLSNDNSCGTAQVSNNILLGPLHDNGGSTPTHALLNGSDGIDSGDAAVCAAVPVNGVDQRGETRPQGSGCDVGAYEFEGQVAAAPTLTMYPDGSYGWTPDQSACTESLYRSSTPYVGHSWLTDDPASYDGSASLTSVETNYFYYLYVDCGGSTAQSDEVGEFTFAIVPGN